MCFYHAMRFELKNQSAFFLAKKREGRVYKLLS